MTTKVKANPCECAAYPFPHRKNGGKCEGGWICPHGFETEDHPDWDGYGCGRCADEEYGDRRYHAAKEDGFIK